MMAHTGLEEFFAAVPEAATPWTLPDGVRVRFELRGEGGGSWTVSRLDGEWEIQRSADGFPDCLLRCSVPDFRALLRGELDPRQGFLEGRLEVEGDVGLVLRLKRSVRATPLGARSR
jgi:hypothetical protein